MGLFNHGMGGGDSFYPYPITQSCRFSDGSGTVRAGETNAPYKLTFSAWVKRSLQELGESHGIFISGADGANWCGLYFSTTDALRFYQRRAGTTEMFVTTPSKLRDPNSWYHIVFHVDAQNATEADRYQIWVNNERFDSTNLTIDTTLAQNDEVYLQYWEMALGVRSYDNNIYLRGYMAEVHYCSGYDYTPDDFGQTKQGVWVPKKFTGSHGTRGWYLDFSNSSDFGEDQSGNNNDFTDTGLTSADQVEDSPTNNYCTLNPIDVSTTTSSTLSDGNLQTDCAADSTSRFSVGSCRIPTSGKWYWEVTMVEKGTSVSNNTWIGLRNVLPPVDSIAYGADDGNYYNGGWSAYGDSYTDGDVIGVAVNSDDGEITFYKNNVSQGTKSISAAEVHQTPWINQYTSATAAQANFNFGQLGFTYTPPAGFKAINSANLPDNGAVSDRYIEGSKGFDTTIYTGDSTNPRAITGLDFSPDAVWFKCRTDVNAHILFDSVRGATNRLVVNDTNVESVMADGLISFDSGGFTIGDNNAVNDGTPDDYVAWCWKEDPAYGFDIVSYTGTAGAQNISHSLGVVPEMIIVKNLDTAQSWPVYHEWLNGGTTPEQYTLYLDLTNAEAASSSRWDDTAPTSSVFRVGVNDGTNGDGDDMIAYLFASVGGFSKVFGYTGNGAAVGPFVYCGFRPRWVLIKCSSNAYNWTVQDTSRSLYNGPSEYYLEPDTSDAESSGHANIDYLSNGFKIRTSNTRVNGGTYTYIGIAFAETPFKYANAK